MDEIRAVYDVAKVRYRGMYLDGVYTKKMALTIKREAERILEFFARQNTALKKLKEKNGG